MKTVLTESCTHYERYTATPSAAAKGLYYYLQWAGHFVCKPDFYIRRVGYQSMLLLQTINGAGTIHYQGQQLSLEPGQFVLIDCMQDHTYYPKGNKPWEFRFLHFTGNRSFEMYQQLCAMAGTFLFPLTPQIQEDIIRCIQCCKEDAVANEVRVSKALSDILYGTALELQQAESGQMGAVCRYIQKHFAEKLSTDALAQVFRFSRSYFSIQFKKHTGTTLHDYVLVCRLHQAKLLLAEGELSISQVAEAVGFADTGTFIRAFQRKEKATPLQYRKQCGIR